MSGTVIGYDLWDRLDGNAIADFDNLEAALEFIRVELDGGGPDSLYRMALCEVSDEGRESKVLAEGEGLVKLVRPERVSR